jgi:PmbA protein
MRLSDARLVELSMNTLNSAVLDETFLQDIVARTLKAGATDAEIRASEGRALSVSVRNQALQSVENAEGQNLHLTAYVGNRKASLSTNDISAASLRDLIERVTTMAKIAPEDPFCGLAPKELVSSGSDEELQLCDPTEMSAAELQALAMEVEDAARSVRGVSQCDGAPTNWSANCGAHVTSNGLSRRTQSSSFGAGVSVIAAKGDAKEVGDAHRGSHWRETLPAAGEIGREAGENAAAKLGSRKIASTNAPVIFDRRIAMSFIGPMLGAISGHSVARGVSFLKDRLEKKVFGTGFEIVDDPFVPRGLGSRAVDGEGISPKRRTIIDGGVLTTWLLDCATARQLKTTTTGHASGAYNLTVTPGDRTREELMSDAGRGLLVTTLFGPSLNPNSGDWSLGVAGFWFENGQLAYPVSEITVAGCLPLLYPLVIVGSDLELRSAQNAPSLLVPQMSIGGK